MLRVCWIFFSNKKYLKEWALDAAKCSMYIGKEYKSYKTSISQIQEIRDYLDSYTRKNPLPYKLKKPSVIRNANNFTAEEKAAKFKERTMCSGNLNALYILPDGKVTICEELYWHPRFILGDLTKQSLMEIWNSQKAKDLFFLKQTEIQKSSPCATCEEYDECRSYKHICWRDTILAYGRDKWDYPDVYCPKAPYIEKDIAL